MNMAENFMVVEKTLLFIQPDNCLWEKKISNNKKI